MFLLLLLFSVPPGGDGAPISCYNDEGAAVDWFYLYKLPKDPDRKSPQQGQLYLLLEKGSAGWTDGTGTVNDSSGALGRTVGQLYSQDQDQDQDQDQNAERAYILYNDQPPAGDRRDRRDGRGDSRGGHTKGVILLDRNQGFWLVHSTPHFPPVQEAGSFSFPGSGVTNGQNFICVTFPLERFQTIGEQLQINQPHVFDCSVPGSLAAAAPALAAVCGGKAVKAATNRSVTLSSRGGTDFISFAKGASFDDDLYHAWVAPTLQSDLLVQFWIRSRGVLPSDCSLGWKVLDVTLIHPGRSFTFRSSQDHSKWAVSPASAAASGGWVCVGDVNRNQAEERRGGGTVCLRDPAVWKSYRTAALQCQTCAGGAGRC